VAENDKSAVLIEIEDDASPLPGPDQVPPVPDLVEMPTGTAMQAAVGLAARPRSPLGRVFWSAFLGFILFAAGIAATNFVTALLDTSPVLGWTALALLGVAVATGLLIAFREWLGYLRLARLDGLRREAEIALSTGSLENARKVAGRLTTLYATRPELAVARTTVKDRASEAFEAEAVFDVAEAHLLAPLDTRAEAEITAAARQVAMVTALVPLAFADVIAALTANIRMIRRIADIYGGRSGTLGGWRLTRTVLTHLVATGAVAVGDDLIGSMAGGGILSKVSRRFGEGVVNGALTARVGVAAMEVCRPLPFSQRRRPSVTVLVKRALTGLFGEKS